MKPKLVSVTSTPVDPSERRGLVGRLMVEVSLALAKNSGGGVHYLGRECELQKAGVLTPDLLAQRSQYAKRRLCDALGRSVSVYKKATKREPDRLKVSVYCRSDDAMTGLYGVRQIIPESLNQLRSLAIERGERLRQRIMNKRYPTKTASPKEWKQDLIYKQGCRLDTVKHLLFEKLEPNLEQHGCISFSQEGLCKVFDLVQRFSLDYLTLLDELPVVGGALRPSYLTVIK